MRTITEIKQIFNKHSGLLKTNELYTEKIFYKDIQKLIQDGFVEKIRYGYYQWNNEDSYSEIIIIKRLFPDGILCMDTALYYYGYSDRIPKSWHIAISKDSNKSRFKIEYPFIKPYYVEPSLLEIGLTTTDIDGYQISIYDKERTICDCLRYSKKMDREIFNKAIQSYIYDTSKNIPHLMKYAQNLRVSEKVKNIIGVWL